MLNNIIKTLIIDMCVDRAFDRLIKQVVTPQKLYVGKVFDVLVLKSIYESNAQSGIFYGAEIIDIEYDEVGDPEYNFIYDECKILLDDGRYITEIEDGEFDAFDFSLYSYHEFSFLKEEVDFDLSK
jgi:hypothetical protein